MTKYLVIRKITEITTEVYEVEVDSTLPKSYREDTAISKTTSEKAIGTDTQWTVNFQVMERKG